MTDCTTTFPEFDPGSDAGFDPTFDPTFDDGCCAPTPDASVGDGTSITIDFDGDGWAETTVVDTDGDGAADLYDIVDPYTGAEVIVADTDGDGLFDTMAADTDGDGQFETGLDTGFDTGVDPLDATTPFPVDPAADDDLDDDDLDDDSDDDSDDLVHGDPMAEVPFHQAQVAANDCLPTSVAMVLTEVTGTEVPQAELVDLADELGLLGPDGMSLEGGVALLDRYGLDAEVQTGTLDGLRTLLDDGTPVIIGLDADDLYGMGDAPFTDDLSSGHAVVITGIDDEAGLVYVNDPGFPDGAGVAVSIEAFEDAWVDSGNSMIVVEADTAGADTSDPGAESTGAESTDDGGAGAGERRASLADLVLLPLQLVVR